MNKSYILCNNYSLLIAKKSKPIDYLSKIYPSIAYDQNTDSFLYRGEKFDYFAAGISIETGLYSYLLVCPEDTRIWLGDYGDKNDRWNEYIRSKLQLLVNKTPI